MRHLNASSVKTSQRQNEIGLPVGFAKLSSKIVCNSNRWWLYEGFPLSVLFRQGFLFSVFLSFLSGSANLPRLPVQALSSSNALIDSENTYYFLTFKFYLCQKVHQTNNTIQIFFYSFEFVFFRLYFTIVLFEI